MRVTEKFKWNALRAPKLPIPLVLLAAFLLSFTATVILGGAQTASATGYTISVVAGSSGAVSTLQCYDPDPNNHHPYYSNKPNPFAPCRSSDDNFDGVTGTHPGSAPVDIAASAYTAVWAQLDYLPSPDRGGYVYIQDTSGACLSWAGSTATATIYHYGPSGGYYAHSLLYEHLYIGANVLNTWFRWNNYNASNPYWPSYLEDFKLSNTYSGGKQVGTIFSPLSGNPSCSIGAHLHQDATSGSWVYNRWAEGCFNDGGAWGGSRCPAYSSVWAWVTGESVTAKYSDAQNTTIQIN